MSVTANRSKIYTDVVTFPTTKTAAALTLSSEEMFPFEDAAWGIARVIVRATDASKIGDTIAISAYVSFDEGDTWIKAGDYTAMANGSGAIASKQTDIPWAPRLRVDAVFDAAATLASGHGCAIDVEFQEMESGSTRVFGDSIVNVGATKTAGDSGLAWYKNGDTITINSPQKLKVLAVATDKSKVTDTLTFTIQSSLDASVWWSQSALGTAKIANGTGVVFLEEEETTNLSKYARLRVTGDTASALATGHGIKYYMMAIDNT